MPKKSKMPIAASRPAACTCGMPKSRHIGIRWTWTRPLVEAPQTKKVANRIQNTEDLEESRSVPSAAAMIGALAGGGAGSGAVPSSPNGRRPTSLGRSRITISTANGGDAEHDADQPQRDAPAVAFGEGREQRQEGELPGRDARGEDADHEAAARHEPAGGDRRAQHQRGHAGADPDHDAPQQHQLPRLASCRARPAIQ